MTTLISLPIACQACDAMPCECASAVEMTQEVPVVVVDLDEEGE